MPGNPANPHAEMYRLGRRLHRRLSVHAPALAAEFAPLLARLYPCRHGPGFSSVLWHGVLYSFSATQARAVEQLWNAWAAGTPEVKQALLLESIDADSDRLASLFKDHPAWGTMIVTGQAKGTFRLSDQ